jgi:hypothetical protein
MAEGTSWLYFYCCLADEVSRISAGNLEQCQPASDGCP